jgi:hypothetical protein
LALFALAVQIVLSFGHVHFYGLGLASAKAATAIGAQDSVAAVPSAPDPIQRSDGSAGVDCAICALIQLSATSAPGAAPAVPLRINLRPISQQAHAASVLAASSHFLFQARAPPSI